MAMLDKLNVIFQRFNEVNDLIIQPDVISDGKRYVQLNREYKNLKPLVEVREQFLEMSSRIEEAKNVLKEEKDADFREMAKMELDELEPAFEALEEEVKILLLPKDPEDDKNALVEIRQGAGLSITTDKAAWVRIYSNGTSRTSDASRLETADPSPDAGVIAEVITTGAETVLMSPSAMGFNMEATPTTNIPCAVTNKSGSAGTVVVTLNVLQLEA